MNEKTAILDAEAKKSVTINTLNQSNSQHEDFPPLPISNKGGNTVNHKDMQNLMDNNGLGSSSTQTNNGQSQPMERMYTKINRIPYANLFKDNRRAKSDYKLEFIEPGTEMIMIEEEHVDSIEKTYGFCLLGYIISGKPPTASLIDLVRRWGPNIQFQTHDSGWIIFKFPSAEIRDKILVGGPYMVYGFHLFIKEMPKCFRFREEDMNSIPSWVQIHGLPPDCWNSYILSRIASVIGKPVHMDMLTHERKRVKYARVLVEMDLTNTKLEEVNIQLPIGIISVNFVYEHEFKLCEHCKKPGHLTENCYSVNTHRVYGKREKREYQSRGRSKSVGRNTRMNRSKSLARVNPNREQIQRVDSSNQTLQQEMVNTTELTDIAPQIIHEEECTHCPKEDEMVIAELQGKKSIDKGKSVIEEELPCFMVNIQKGPLFEKNKGMQIDGMTKNQMKKEKKKNNKKGANGSSGKNGKMTEFFADMEDGSSCDTEYVKRNESTNKNERFFGNEEKGRHPKSASGTQ